MNFQKWELFSGSPGSIQHISFIVGKIITKEESAEGSVTWKVYGTFMKAAGGELTWW